MDEEKRKRLFEALARDLLMSWFGRVDEEHTCAPPDKDKSKPETEHIGRRNEYGSDRN